MHSGGKRITTLVGVRCYGAAPMLHSRAVALKKLEIMTPSVIWRQLLSSFGRHVGVFLLLFGGMWLVVHFLRLSPTLLYAVPALYFVYLGAMLVLGTRKRKCSPARERK